jgi:hypothetical protein
MDILCLQISVLEELFITKNKFDFRMLMDIL